MSAHQYAPFDDDHFATAFFESLLVSTGVPVADQTIIPGNTTISAQTGIFSLVNTLMGMDLSEAQSVDKADMYFCAV
jgi:hypothetical protein